MPVTPVPPNFCRATEMAQRAAAPEVTNPEAGGPVMVTATTDGARDHARAQEGGRAEAMPVVPAAAWPDPPGEAGELVSAETVAGGNYTHRVLARGTKLRL